jgi:hypothetical protein
VIGSENENELALDNVAGNRERTQSGTDGNQGGSARRSDHWRVAPFTPPPPPSQGGERWAGSLSLARAVSIGSLACAAFHPPPPPPGGGNSPTEEGALPTRNGRILISSGNFIAVCADHSCRQGVRCRMPDFYRSSICELQPLNVRSRTTRFFGLPCAPAGLRHLRWNLSHGGGRRARDLH